MTQFSLSYSSLNHCISVNYSSLATRGRARFLLCISHSAFLSMLDQIEALYDNWDYDDKNFVRNYPRSETSFPFLINESHSSSKNEGDHSEPDAEVSKMLDEIYARLLQLYKRGISTRTIHEKLLERQIPSRLVFTYDNKLLLPDYDNLEVVLTPLPKAL